MKNTLPTPADYADASVVAQESMTSLLARLELVMLKPSVILDVGCRVGHSTALLRKRYPDATIIATDHDPEMVRFAEQKYADQQVDWQCVPDLSSLSIPAQQVDLIVANLVLPWATHRQALMTTWRRLLRPEGLLILTSLGPDTLKECQSMQCVPERVDMHHLGDELVQAGLLDPVLEVEYITLKYRQREQMMRELYVTHMITDESIALDNASLTLTYEIIQGHAWGPSAFKADETGVVKIPLEHLRRRDE